MYWVGDGWVGTHGLQLFVDYLARSWDVRFFIPVKKNMLYKCVVHLLDCSVCTFTRETLRKRNPSDTTDIFNAPSFDRQPDAP